MRTRSIAVLSLLFAEGLQSETLELRAGSYGVTLRLPPGGLFALEENQLEFRVVDHNRVDPLQGPTPVIRAKIVATISMPSMAGMPRFEERAHPEPLPGDYGVHPTFAHGGGYLLNLEIAPPEDQPFLVEFPLQVRDAQSPGVRKRAPPPYELELRSTPKKPAPGQAAELELVIKARENSKKPHAEFNIVHEKLMHLILVRDDLTGFAHEHPVMDPRGIFRLRYTFPAPGRYHLFADVAPKGAGTQMLMVSITVRGTASPRSSVDRLPQSLVSGNSQIEMRLLAPGGGLPVRKTIPLSVDLRDLQSGAAVAGLEPYLGAMGHLILIHHDATTYVHAHPDDSQPENQGMPAFLVRLPKPGVYRAWLQVKRAGEIVTGDFVVHASDGFRDASSQ